MGDFWGRLFDPSGFIPPAGSGGDWSPGLIWLHVGSDLFIWLACLATAFVLVYHARRRSLRPTHLIVLATVSVVTCGFAHFADAMMFSTPAYRFTGVLKLVTAVVVWATVLTLISTSSRVAAAFSTAAGGGAPRPTRPVGRGWDYVFGLLVGALALFIRAGLDPFLKSDHAFVLPLLAVVCIAWQSGFGPAVVTLLASMIGTVYFFVEPRYTFAPVSSSDQIAVGAFFFCGVACAALGQAQLAARVRARAALMESEGRRAELEAEVVRRTAVEADLRASEGFRRGVLENSPDCIKILDLTGRVLEMNGPGLCAMEIDDFDRVRGGEWAEFWPTPEAARAAVAAARNGEIGRFRGPCPTFKGTLRYWDVQLAPIPGPDGRPVRLVGVSRDITDIRRIEEEVRASAERFQTLADNISQFAWMADETGAVFWYNRRWYEYTGTTPDQMRGWGWRAVHHPDHLDRVAAKFQAHITRGEPWEDTFPLRGADGGYRWYLSRALPVRDEVGTIVRWFGTNTDIDDAKLHEEQLRLAVERFRQLTEAIPQLVWAAEPDGRITFFNHRWVEYTGMTVDRAGDEGWWAAVVHPADVARAAEVWRPANGADDRSTHEYRVRRVSDGAHRWMLVTVVRLRDPAGQPAEWVGTLTDIDDQKRQAEYLERLVRERTADLEGTNTALREQVTERQRAEEKARETARELQRSNAELEQFAYVASHDLQEPLRKIQAFGDLLQTKVANQLPDPGREYVRKMQGSAGRMSNLIDDLLAYSRVTTHARPFTQTDLSAVLADVLDDLETRIERTGATVEVGQLPVVEADPTQMRQLFQNLIGNALKFSRPGVPPVVRVLAEVVDPASGPDTLPGPAVSRVTVEDNGIGFDQKYATRIFQVFQRLHGRGEYEGTGVGLAICKKIADRHGGTIAAASRLGEGTTFTVALPVRQGHSSDPGNDGGGPGPWDR